MKLRNTNIYLSEDLTVNPNKLSYDTCTYTKTLKGASTWTTDDKVYLKDAEDARPCVVYSTTDLKLTDNQ